MTTQQFIEALNKFNENALYFLTFQVNLSKNLLFSKSHNSIDRIFAICPAKQTIYIENYDFIDCDNIRSIHFSDIEQYMTEKEMSDLLLLMQKRLYKTSYIDYFFKYESNLLEELSMKDFSNKDVIQEACFAIQEILNITHGDNAVVFFDESRRSATLTQAEKHKILTEYIEFELDSLRSTDLILTVAVEVEYIEKFDIDSLTIEDIIFSNTEILNVSSVSCDIVEEV